MDLRILHEWEQTKLVEEKDVTPVGPFNVWECTIMHPIEMRRYHIDLKKLETHWRMRVYYRSIREGHRFMRAIFPSNPDDAKEAQFLAMKFLNRYFEEQLAMYNAICILHVGQKFTELCDCDDSDHSQHLENNMQPLMPYDGVGFPYRARKVENKGDLCNMCLGESDIEAYMHSDVCPWCRTELPKTEKEFRNLEKLIGSDFYAEYRKQQVNNRRGTENPASTEGGANE
jgi:uncharacterized CHY-type Zn-finger protein